MPQRLEGRGGARALGGERGLGITASGCVMVRGPVEGPGMAGAEDPGIRMEERGEGWKTPENQDRCFRGEILSRHRRQPLHLC